MASFAKDVTTPIDVPQVQAPDFSQSTSTAQDIVGLASFGMQIANRQNQYLIEFVSWIERLIINNALHEIKDKIMM